VSPRQLGRLRSVAVAAMLAIAGAGAHAQLFPDNEARKAIVDLRERVNQNEEQTRARLAELLAKQTQNADQLRGALLDLNGQLESLRSEIARLRGQQEQLTRELSDVQRRQKDIAQGVDERMRRFEPQTVSVDGKEFQADIEEKRQYDDAIALLRNGDFAGASAALSTFARRYPASGYADSARFWLGNALYGKRDYPEAIKAFRSFLATAPNHPRAPEAMLAVANCQVETKDTRAAKLTLAELLKTYPASEAAQAGKERLASLK
jgi:tol-pal system protein YbgF